MNQTKYFFALLFGVAGLATLGTFLFMYTTSLYAIESTETSTEEKVNIYHFEGSESSSSTSSDTAETTTVVREDGTLVKETKDSESISIQTTVSPDGTTTTTKTREGEAVTETTQKKEDHRQSQQQTGTLPDPVKDRVGEQAGQATKKDEETIHRENIQATKSEAKVPTPAQLQVKQEAIQRFEEVKQKDKEAVKVDQKIREQLRSGAPIDSFKAEQVAERVQEEILKKPPEQEVVKPKVEERKEKVREITAERPLAEVRVQKEARAREVRTPDEVRALERVLKSSIPEIERLLEKEAGEEIIFTPRNRPILEEIETPTPEFQERQERVREGGGLAHFIDSDSDGISDFDEIHVYGTDPFNAYTAGGVLTDGERVLLGLDPLSTSSERVAVESPRARTVSEDSQPLLFEVYTIEPKWIPSATVDEEYTEEIADSALAEESGRVAFSFSGRALPNSFVTLFIFSTPIVVTAKADSSGFWTYTLTEELENGSHELFVATVDRAGKIIAQSPSVPFVKVAEAVEFTPLTYSFEPAGTSVVEVLEDNMIMLAVFLLIVLFVIVVFSMGVWRSRRIEDTA